MAHKQRTPFTLKSGNKTSFKAMGSSPMQERFASPEAAGAPAGHNMGKLPQGGINGQATLPQGGISGQAMATPASKPQTPEMMEARKAREEWYLKARAQQGLGGTAQAPGAPEAYAPDEKMKKHFANMTPEQKFALSSTSVRTPVGASRPQEQGNPVQAPQAANMKQGARGDYENFERKLKGEESSNRSRYGQVRGLVNTNAQAPAQAAVQSAPRTQAPQAAVQSAPRPDLSGGPRQPMGRPRQPMSGPSQPMGAPRQPMGGPGMGRARRAAGRVGRSRRAASLAGRVRRSRG